MAGRKLSREHRKGGDRPTEIELPEGDALKLDVSAAGGKPQRLVVATCGEVEHRDRLNTDSSVSRDRFVKRLAVKLGIDREVLVPRVDPQLMKLADEIDESVGAGGTEVTTRSRA